MRTDAHACGGRAHVCAVTTGVYLGLCAHAHAHARDPRHTSVLRASPRALTALAAAPLDTVLQDSVLADTARMIWVCGGGISASLTVHGPSVSSPSAMGAAGGAPPKCDSAGRRTRSTRV
jgi:hypothetical protein